MEHVPIIGGKFIFFVGVATIVTGIVKVIEHEINYRANTDREIKELKEECKSLKNELQLANNVINDYNH